LTNSKVKNNGLQLFILQENAKASVQQPSLGVSLLRSGLHPNGLARAHVAGLQTGELALLNPLPLPFLSLHFHFFHWRHLHDHFHHCGKVMLMFSVIATHV
jgi:hypothetical protein